MTNVIKFKTREHNTHHVAPRHLSLSRLKWIEVNEDVYDWFALNPRTPRHTHQYGFLHYPTNLVFVRLPYTRGSFICGMSVSKYTVSRFNYLARDTAIDAVIEDLGYEPTVVA